MKRRMFEAMEVTQTRYDRSWTGDMAVEMYSCECELGVLESENDRT